MTRKSEELVSQLVRRRMEPDWLAERRAAAWQLYKQLPAYRTTQSDLTQRPIDPVAATEKALHCPEEGLTNLSRYFEQTSRNRLIFVNDIVTVYEMEAELVEQGVLLAELSLAARLFPSRVRPYLGRLLEAGENPCTALNEAIWNAGAILYIPAGVQVKQPIQLWWHRTRGGGQLHPRLLVVACEGSEATVVLGETSELTEAASSVQAVEVYARKNARVRVAAVQEQAAPLTRVALLKARAESGALVDWSYADLGAGYTVARVENELLGEASAARLQAGVLGQGAQHLDLTLHARHVGRGTQSDMQVRAVLQDTAKTVCQAVSQIERGAVGTNATQEARMLLLDKSAQASPIPMRLIAEEDVRCDHAVSVERLAQESLFYLMSRGLPREAAQALLIRAFLAPLTDRLPVEALADVLVARLEARVEARLAEEAATADRLDTEPNAPHGNRTEGNSSE